MPISPHSRHDANCCEWFDRSLDSGGRAIGYGTECQGQGKNSAPSWLSHEQLATDFRSQW